ncbi:hypothetical protein A2U01_0087991, partial [Trifolium medium]|nr:hypothetical protein [Trifolium medium]
MTSNVKCLTYRFLAELDSPPPANPPAIVLTATRFLSPLFASPPSFLGGIFPASGGQCVPLLRLQGIFA